MIGKAIFTGDNGLRLSVDAAQVSAVYEAQAVKGAARIGRAERPAGTIMHVGNDSFWVAESFDDVKRALGAVTFPGSRTIALGGGGEF